MKPAHNVKKGNENEESEDDDEESSDEEENEDSSDSSEEKYEGDHRTDAEKLKERAKLRIQVIIFINSFIYKIPIVAIFLTISFIVSTNSQKTLHF